MIIFHGSLNIIRKPQFLGGYNNNDYGNGFYTTNISGIAREWAVTPKQNGYLNVYELDTNGLKFVDLNQPNYTVLNWLALLYKNRRINGINRYKDRIKDFLKKFLPDISKADVVIGYRADDRYFRFGKSFIRNDLPLLDLEDSLILGNLGQQIFLQSQDVFKPNRLKFIRYENVLCSEWYFKKEKRENEAKAAFKTIEDRPQSENEITINNILKGDGWKMARPANELSSIKIELPNNCILINAPYQLENKQNNDILNVNYMPTMYM